MSELPVALIKLERSATTHWFPCGDGQMPIRRWSNRGAEKVVLLHGGSGSWLHWVRTIEALQVQFDVYAIDLPGLGDAAMCSIHSDAGSAADSTASALETLFMEPFHIVAFSWGCTISAMLMQRLEPLLRSVLLAGPAAVGDLPRRQQMQPLLKRTPGMSREQVLATQRENLSRLMIHDADRIDEMAVQIQDINTSKARFSSPQYARSELLIEGVHKTDTPLYVIYGEFDAPAYPSLDARRELFIAARPDVKFEVVADAGHWLQYEQPVAFNNRCLSWLKLNSGI